MMEERQPRRRGAPPGNQNASKHGFYSKVLTSGERRLLPDLAKMRGLDREIAVARVKVLSIIARDPRNITLLLRALSSLTSMVQAQETIDRHIRREAQEATETM